MVLDCGLHLSAEFSWNKSLHIRLCLPHIDFSGSNLSFEVDLVFGDLSVFDLEWVARKKNPLIVQ